MVWMFDTLKTQCDLKNHLLELGSHQEVKYLNRVELWKG